MSDWTYYRDRKPEQKRAYYQWRIESKVTPGLFILFLAEMRLRGAGFESTYSPEFDHWDGYRVLVPNDTQWRAIPEGVATPSQSYRFTRAEPEGVENLACPYCGRIPTWNVRCSGYTNPHHIDSWGLTCCSFGGTAQVDDPRKLAERRNKVLIDGERWRALMSSQRMHIMGWSGFKVDGPKTEDGRFVPETAKVNPDTYQLFGMEFWSEHSAYKDPDFPDTFERDLLTKYVDHLRSRKETI